MAAVVVVVGAVVGVVVATSGGGDDGADTSIREPVSPDQSSTTQSAPDFEACIGTFEVLEPADIEQVAGVAVGEGTRDRDAGCAFPVGDSAVVEEVYHYDGVDAALIDIEQYKLDHDEQAVSGLGDEAFIDPAGKELVARSGLFNVYLSYTGSDDAVTGLELVELARIVFERNGA